MNFLQRAVKYLFFSKSQKYLLELHSHGYLFDQGFVKSKDLDQVVFADGTPAPWLSYPFLDFFIPRLNKSFSLFEYGLGNSSLYYSTKIEDHFGVEHDSKWYEILMDKHLNGDNFKNCSDLDYINAIDSFDRKFDIIIIDGILREECIVKAMDYLTSRGVIILDDSERSIFLDSKELLRKAQFRSLPFFGMKAYGRHNSSTTVFYRPDNCLDI